MAKLAFSLVKNVTLPLLKLDDKGVPVYVKIDRAIYKADPIQGKAPAEGSNAQMNAPDLMEVTELESGEMMQMIANDVLKKNLEKQYPDATYVGKCFQIRKFAAQGNKKYATFQIAEIAVNLPEAEGEPDAVASAVAEETAEAETVPPTEHHRGSKRK